MDFIQIGRKLIPLSSFTFELTPNTLSGAVNLVGTSNYHEEPVDFGELHKEEGEKITHVELAAKKLAGKKVIL